ncbi:MAG: TolC family protein [Victivallaceae bacterium]|nr:TolC family protein [Victivallaceae bacterium]
MMSKILLTVGLGGALAVAFVSGGCYDYPKPPAATLGNSYTNRDKDKADELLKDVKVLSLADAQRISIINNPTYIAAYHAVSAARMRYYQSIGAYSPTVTAGFNLQNSNTWTRNADLINANARTPRTDTFSTNTTLTASWLVFDGFSRTLSVLIAKHNYDYQALMEANECRTLMYSVATAYNDLLLAIENIRIAKENRGFQEALVRYTKLKYQAGTVPLSDVLNFEIQMNSADGDMLSAQFQYDTAIYSLAVLMGYPEGTLPDGIEFPTDYKNKYTDLPPVDSYLDQALANRPDLKGYRELFTVAQYQVDQQYSSYSPTVNAFFNMGWATNDSNYHYGNYTNYNNRQYTDSPSISYGFAADWVIFNGFARYNKMREYQANAAVAEYNVAASWLNVVGQVRASYANYVQSVRQTKIYEATRDLSAQQRVLVDEGYKAGNTEITRLNEAQRDLVQAETNLASSYINIQNAKAQLDASVGAYTVEYYRGEKAGRMNSGLLPDKEIPEEVPAAQAAPGISNAPAAPANPAAPAIPASATTLP